MPAQHIFGKTILCHRNPTKALAKSLEDKNETCFGVAELVLEWGGVWGAVAWGVSLWHVNTRLRHLETEVVKVKWGKVEGVTFR